MSVYLGLYKEAARSASGDEARAARAGGESDEEAGRCEEEGRLPTAVCEAACRRLQLSR